MEGRRRAEPAAPRRRHHRAAFQQRPRAAGKVRRRRAELARWPDRRPRLRLRADGRRPRISAQGVRSDTMAEMERVRERERPPLKENPYERIMRQRKELAERNL